MSVNAFRGKRPRSTCACAERRRAARSAALDETLSGQADLEMFSRLPHLRAAKARAVERPGPCATTPHLNEAEPYANRGLPGRNSVVSPEFALAERRQPGSTSELCRGRFFRSVAAAEIFHAVDRTLISESQARSAENRNFPI